MGRPERHDVDYFPFYAKDGRTLFILESKYQCKGTGFFTNVLRFLALQTDHHFSIEDDADKLYFFSKTKVDDESGMDMLNIMVKTGKLDSELFDRGIIASEDFLDSIGDAYRKRLNDCITIEDIRGIYQVTGDVNQVTGDGNAGEQDLSGVTPDSNPQSIVKKKRVKKTYTKPFLEFYSKYPLKENKGAAFKAWKKIPDRQELLPSMLEAIAAQVVYKANKKARGDFCPEWPHPSTWLNNARWEDEIQEDTCSGQSKGTYESLPRNERGETEFVQRMREEEEEKERQANG